MAAGDSFAYCDSDEEIFAGKVTQKELLKLAILGQNYDSPDVKSAPRSKTLNKSTNLPDVLNGSTSKVLATGNGTPASAKKVEISKHSRHFPSPNSSFDEDDMILIDLDSGNNSVQIISDDESFLLNEKLVQDNDTVLDITKENFCLNKGLESLCVSCIKDNVEGSTIENTCNNVIADIVGSEKNNISEDKAETPTETNDDNSSLTCPSLESYHGREITQVADGTIVGNQNIEDLEETNGIASGMFQHECQLGLGVTMDYKDNNEGSKTDHTLPNDSFEYKLVLEKAFDNDSKHELESFVETSKYSEINTPVPLPKDSLMKSSVQLDLVKCTPILEENNVDRKNFSPNKSCSDSVLNMSHGSSLSTPTTPVADKSSLGLLANVIYEDISCDEDLLFDLASRNTSIRPELSLQHEDLHMSGDEPDYRWNLTTAGTSENISQPSLYKSCFDKSSVSSYHTAPNTNSDIHNSQPSAGSFNSYREALNDSVDLEVIDVVNGLDNDNESKNETSFEIIVQNRQNSFTPSSPSDDKVVDKTEQVKPKIISKLPVFNYSSKSLIKPSKLNVTSGSLKVNNYKWAKNLQKSDSDKINSNKEGIGATKAIQSKIPSPHHKANCFPKSQQKNGNTPNQKASTQISYRPNTPSVKITPAKTIACQTLRVVTSESKTPNVSRPTPNTKNTLSSENKFKSKMMPPSFSQEKSRYKNIISPIRAYICGSPSVLQEKTVASERTKLIGRSDTHSHLPMRIMTPRPVAKVVQKLNYDKMPGQENVDPNYSRDTLPPTALKNSEAVFMKEPEPPKKYLPKMGGTLKKLLDTPRPKVVVHQGRVKNSPSTKGVLVQSADMKSPEQDLGVSIRVVKAAENSNNLK